MPKETTPSVQNSQSSSELTPATFRLVGLDEAAQNVYVVQLQRSYTKAELLRPDLAVLLHTMGWPHIEKN
ncbi:hypothetical protein [Spirosoma areae]